jgi:hypothetical protein
MRASSQVKPNETFSLAPKTLEEAMKYSEMLAKSTIIPRNYQGKPGDILVAVQMGMELGLKPIQSLQNIAVINGKPCIYGDVIMSLTRIHPEFEDIKEYFDEKLQAAVCEVKRRNQTVHKTIFSIDDAKKAGLWGKPGPWVQYPKRMLQMRARSFALRDTFPDALLGLILAEEAMDYKDLSSPNNIYDMEKSNNAADKPVNDSIPVGSAATLEPIKAPSLSLAEQVTMLIEERDVPMSDVQKWLTRGGVKNVWELSNEELNKCIVFINEKY